MGVSRLTGSGIMVMIVAMFMFMFVVVTMIVFVFVFVAVLVSTLMRVRVRVHVLMRMHMVMRLRLIVLMSRHIRTNGADPASDTLDQHRPFIVARMHEPLDPHHRLGLCSLRERGEQGGFGLEGMGMQHERLPTWIVFMKMLVTQEPVSMGGESGMAVSVEPAAQSG